MQRGPLSPPVLRSHEPDHLPAYLSNGVIGVRVHEVPLRSAVAVVNGLAGMHPVEQVESTPYAPYPFAIDICVDGVWASDALECVRHWEQRYDFACGELTSNFEMRIGDMTVTAEVVMFCSRTQPALVCQEMKVETDGVCGLALRAGIDMMDIAGRFVDRSVPVPGDDGAPVDGALLWETEGALGRCGAAYSTEFLGTDDVRRDLVAHAAHEPLHTTYRFRARRRRQYVLRQITGLVGSEAHHQPHRQATRLVARGRRTGFERLRSDNRSAWDDLWKARPVLVGAETRWQQLADAAFAYLNASVHPGSISATHLFGLGRWPTYHYYYGHVMWDIEMFAFPSLVLVQPDAARALLDFRVRTMESARKNAQMNGYQGLQYPWQAGPRRGEEAAPGGGDAAAYEHHVSMAVARAFVRYADATRDEAFLRRAAWPIVEGVAQFIASRARRTERGYEILDAMGIAERRHPADNVAYVNMTAAVVLRDAIALARRVGCSPPSVWQRIADDIVLPLDERRDVILDHDGYQPDEEKGATPATLAGFFPFGYEAERKVERATIEFYLSMWKEYVGQPMLSALYGVWAARIDDRALAARLLDEGYAKFVSPRFLNTHEYRDDKFPDQPVAGPFYANLGGFLMSCYFGFPGIEIGADEPVRWARRPVVLPEGWDCIEVDRLWVRGRPARLVARHGAERAELTFAD